MSMHFSRPKIFKTKTLSTGWTFFLVSFTLLSSTPTTAVAAQQTDSAAQSSASPADSPTSLTALTGAHILSMGPAGEIASGTILIREGKIEAIGDQVSVPPDARVIDLTGRTITPGWIDLQSTLWLTENAASDSGSTASLEVIDGVNPFSLDWREVARQGITTVYVQPASTGTLGGFGAVLRVAPGQGELERLVLKNPAGFQCALGLGNNPTPRTRLSQFEGIKKRLEEAKQYREAWEKYRKSEGDRGKKTAKKDDSAKPASRDDGNTSDARGDEKAPTKPKFDAQKERLVRVLSKEIPLRVEIQYADDAERVLELAKELDITVVLGGLSSLGSHRELVRQAGVPIILGPWLDPTTNRDKTAQRTKNWVQAFANYPGRIAVATFDSLGRGSKSLRQHLGVAISAGLPVDRALASVTTVPAAILGMEGKIGVLREGNNADLVVFAGNPLDPATTIEWTFSMGESTFSNPAITLPIQVTEEHPSGESPATHLPKGKQPGNFAIRTKHILRDNGEFSPGCLVVEDQKISMIGDYEMVIPDDLPRFTLDHAFLTPGFVVAHTFLSNDRGADRQSLADSGPGQASDSFDPAHPDITHFVRGGFLRAGHAGSNLRVIAGPLAEIRLSPKNSSVIEPVIAEKMVLAGTSRKSDRFPSSLAGQQQLVHETFKTKSFEAPFVLPAAASKVMSELRAARLGQLLSGQRPVLFEVDEDAEIIAAVRLARQYGLKSTLLGPNRLDVFASTLAEHQMGVVVRPLKSTDYDWRAKDIALASNAGVRLAFAGDDPTTIRATVASAIQSGMAPASALRALTSGGASLLGMSATAGTLQEASPADFVLWNASPLNLAARPLAIVVDGTFFDTEH